MKIHRQHIVFENGAQIIIQENPEGRIYIECHKLEPVIVLHNRGVPGVIGPNIQIDTTVAADEIIADAKHATW